MKKQGTFGHVALAEKFASQFGTTQETIKAEMRYTEMVLAFIRKVGAGVIVLKDGRIEEEQQDSDA